MVYYYETEINVGCQLIIVPANRIIGERSEPLSMVFNGKPCDIREYGSTLYVGLACAVSPTNTNFRLTFLLTRLQEALYEDLAV